jgi:PAS domain S-box-containing protein
MNAIKDKKQYHILLVEDNPGDYTLIEDYLVERFVLPKISWAQSFKRAEALLKETTTPFDIVLLDLTLPDNSGEKLINDMSLYCHEYPIIILTGYSDNMFAVKSLSLGISDYLNKDELNANSLYKSIIYNIERKKMRLQLETSERRYSDLFHLSPQPMWVYDIETLRFLDVNIAAEKHYGYTLQEFLGMTIKDIRPEEDVPALIERVENLNKNFGSYAMGTFRHKKKNGEVIHVEIQSNTLPFQETVGRIILANDVTERFAYIEAVEKQNEKLKEIAWIQSHIVRAPLARMMSIIDIIKNYGFDDNDSETLLNHLLTSAEELDVIIKDISKKSEAIKLDLKK